MERKMLEREYLVLGNKLEKANPTLNFKNHCYWRIANDYACKDKWTTVIKSPFYKKASIDQLYTSVQILAKMLYSRNSKQVINYYNTISLNMRDPERKLKALDWLANQSVLVKINKALND